MKQQKLVQIRLERQGGNKLTELCLQKYLDNGWKIVSYQVCPQGDGYAGDVVVLLEKEQ